MKKFLILAVLLLAVALGILGKAYRSAVEDRNRLARNQSTLLDSVDHYRTAAGREAASVQALELKVSELERYKADAAAEIRSLGIKLRRVESVATTTTRTEVRITAPLTDADHPRSEVLPEPLTDSMEASPDRILAGRLPVGDVKKFRWDDGHVGIRGIIEADSVRCEVISIDTLRQIVHRVPRRFLFIRWGTKAIRQEIVSTNPHTRIVYAEYIDMRRKKK